jgi:aminopeptidase N
MRKFVPILLLLLFLTALFATGNTKKNSGLDVVRYTFKITLSDECDTIWANAIIQAVVLETSDSLRFDLRNVQHDGRGMIVSGVNINLDQAEWSHRNDKVSATVDGGFNPGTVVTVSVSYKGIPANGLVISKTKFGKRSFFADHWPDRGSHYLPCIDHVSDKAAVEFIITAPDVYTVVSNGNLMSINKNSGGTKTTHWREDVPIPVKVMTFGAAEFAVEEAGIASGAPVYSYVYPENREKGFSDYSIALEPLNFYSQLIGPYPYPKLANVQSKTMFGGLENAGCIFYSEGSVSGTGRSEGLIAHEIAHQWFGNSVTENDWHHIWLSEGFATYLTSMYWEMKQGEERLRTDMRSARERVLRAAAQNPRPVIDTAVTDLMRLLSANSYQKGAWVLHMLRDLVGEEDFLKGLQLYYKRFRNSNALTDDFRMVMEEVSRKYLGQFFHQWLMVAGQPDIRTEWTSDLNSGTVKITVTQVQDYIFIFPLELEIKSQNSSEIIKLDVTERVTEISLPLSTEPTEVITDPYIRLLFRPITN